MKRLYSKIGLLTVNLFMIYVLASCQDMPVGYLKAENAEYVPDSLVAYQEVDEEDAHITDNAPWTSYAIQGVAGTVPITYEFYDVETTEGGDATAFRKAIEKGTIKLQGSLIQVFYAASKELPEGRYCISLRVHNEDHSAILPNIFTIIIKKNEFGDDYADWEEEGAGHMEYASIK